ncbi:MAG: DnaD domain protein [Bacillota bacterium]
MSFIIETTDMDLGDTPIENIFINDYMPMANGTYVKVYLLGYKYAHDRDDRIEVTNKTIAKHLDIPMEDVLRAWDFWENKGIIRKEGTDDVDYWVTFLNLKQLFIKNNLMAQKNSREEKKPRASSEKDLIEANQIPLINNMFNNIDYMMRRQTAPMEKKQILSWIQDYNMNPDVIEKAVSYGAEVKNKRSIKYIEGIIRNWYDQGLTNMDAVMEYFNKVDKKYFRYQKVMKSIGLEHKGVTDGDLKVVNKWFDQYGYTMELVLKGCETANKVQYPTINYIDGVISDWHNKGIKEVADIEVMDKQEEKPARKQYKASGKSTASHKTRFHNFEQRSAKYSPEDLEQMAKRKREAHRMKGNGGSDE